MQVALYAAAELQSKVRGVTLLNCSGAMNQRGLYEDDATLAALKPVFWVVESLLKRKGIATWLFEKFRCMLDILELPHLLIAGILGCTRQTRTAGFADIWFLDKCSFQMQTSRLSHVAHLGRFGTERDSPVSNTLNFQILSMSLEQDESSSDDEGVCYSGSESS